MDDLSIGLSTGSTIKITFDVSPFTGSLHRIHLMDRSLIPNGDGVYKTDWLITGDGIDQDMLADIWISCYIISAE